MALSRELAALDRKIAAALAPKHDEKDGEEIKRDEPQQKQEAKTVDLPTQSSEPKKTMVAEPSPRYDHQQREQQSPPRFVASVEGFNQPSMPRSSGIKF